MLARTVMLRTVMSKTLLYWALFDLCFMRTTEKGCFSNRRYNLDMTKSRENKTDRAVVKISYHSFKQYDVLYILLYSCHLLHNLGYEWNSVTTDYIKGNNSFSLLYTTCIERTTALKTTVSSILFIWTRWTVGVVHQIVRTSQILNKMSLKKPK